MRKVYSKELGIYIYVDPVTREQIGGGLFDSIFGTAAKQLAKETIKKSAVAALDTGSKKLGEKVGEYVADKIMPTKPVASPAALPVTTTKPAKPGALIKEIKKYNNDSAYKLGQLLGKGIKARINRLL